MHQLKAYNEKLQAIVSQPGGDIFKYMMTEELASIVDVSDARVELL